MQVFKKFCALAVASLLIGCRSSSVTTNGEVYEHISDIDEASFETPSSFRVGVLLPLSGDAARYGQGLKQAALMALEDMNNDNLILQFYDTQSSPEGAEEAAENAIRQKAQMIIGPLTGTSVRAISDETKARGIPVVAFSTDSGALQSQVYTLGLLVEEQVNRIIGYAAAKGRRNFALLVPDNSTGIAAAQAAVKTTAGSDAKVIKIAFYSPKSTDFSEVIRQMSDYERRSAGINKEKNRLKALAQKGDTEAAKALRRLAAKDTAMNGYNLFVKQNIYVFNERTLFDPARLLLVFGTLPPMNCLELAEQTGRRIVLTWKNSLEPAGVRATDRVGVVALCEGKMYSPLWLDKAVSYRQEQRVAVELEGLPAGTVHLYCFFVSADGTAYSPGSYLCIHLKSDV